LKARFTCFHPPDRRTSQSSIRG